MHPFRFALTRGAMIHRAPEDDTGSDYDELPEEADEVDEEPEDQEETEEPDEVYDEDDPEPEPERPARKSFAQRVEEVAERKIAERLKDIQPPAAQPAPQPRETPDQFRERIANMDQVQFAEYMLAQQNQTLQQIQFQAQDSADKTAYEAMASSRPIAAKLKDEVEARLADMRKNNLTAPRETILKYLIGERALANTTRATTRATKAAASRKDTNAARPANGRGDAVETGRRGNDAQARAKRLSNLNI